MMYRWLCPCGAGRARFNREWDAIMEAVDHAKTASENQDHVWSVERMIGRGGETYLTSHGPDDGEQVHV